MRIMAIQNGCLLLCKATQLLGIRWYQIHDASLPIR